jgi:hypothetical protein
MTLVDIDALGEKGEMRFGELCADAELICNKAGRDRAGWDFVVNFGQPGDGPLDARHGALSCYVQVKTILSTSRTAKLKLNMAERLAKEPKPSFILIFKVDATSKSFTGASLIHVAGNRLGAILKRLREIRKNDPACELHSKFITFTPTAKEAIELSGSALKAALSKHIGSSLPASIAQKQADLKKIGFDDHPYTVNTTFQGLTESQLVNAFLGLSEDVPNTRVQLSETRFGITITEPEAIGSIKISPHPSESCLITYRAAPLDIPIILRGEVLRAPIIGSIKRTRIKHPFMDILIDLSDSRLSFNYELTFRGQQASLIDWLNYWRFVKGLYSDKGCIELRLDSATRPLEIRLSDHEITEERAKFSAEATLCERCFHAFSDLCQRAGIASDTIVSSEDIFKSFHAILVFQRLLLGDKPILEYPVETDALLLERRATSALIADSIQVGPWRFAMYGIAQVSIDETTSRASLHDFSIKRIQAIENTADVYENFCMTAAEIESADIVLCPPWKQHDD